MGDESVVECVNDGKGGKSVSDYMYWKFGKNKKRMKFNDGIVIKNY
jgi:hypothetical protein